MVVDATAVGDGMVGKRKPLFGYGGRAGSSGMVEPNPIGPAELA